jgi:uncharacterized membrane protein
MFDSFGEFFWAFMSLSGFMFWASVLIFCILVIRRNREKNRRIFRG